MRNSSFEEIGCGLKIGIEDSDKFVVFDIATIHGGFEVASLITISNDPMTINNVGALLLPFINLLFNEQLGSWIIRIIKNLD